LKTGVLKPELEVEEAIEVIVPAPLECSKEKERMLGISYVLTGLLLITLRILKATPMPRVIVWTG